MNHHTMTTAFIEMIQEYVDKESKTIEARINRVADLSDYERVKKVNELDEIARRLTEIENKLK